MKNVKGIFVSVTKRALGMDFDNAKRRIDVCKKCEHRKKDPVYGGYMCGECFCPLANITRLKDGCKLNKWDV